MNFEELRKAAHEAPMNRVAQDHRGRRSLATHSMAWAVAGRAYCKAMAEAERQASKEQEAGKP